MKNPLVTMTAAVLAALAFASCASVGNVRYWDENLSPEESVLLYIGWEFTVTSYNGVPVDWGKNVSIYLPPGETALTMNYNINLDFNSIYKGTSTFTRDFKAGDVFVLSGGVQDDRLGVLLYNKPIVTMGARDISGRSEFYPFPDSEPGKIVLE